MKSQLNVGWFTFLVPFLLSNHAGAGVVLLKGVSSSTIDYQATLTAHPDSISPVQQILKSKPTREHRERLITEFAEAQKAFLEKSPTESEAKFKEVLELLPLDDWNPAEREIFLFSYLRLAQLTTDPGVRDKWLSQSLLLKTKPSKAQISQIPPPLLLRQSELLKEIPKSVLRTTSPWDQVLINGSPCQGTSCGEWPLYPLPVRITFLSNQWQPQTMIVELAKLTSLRPKQVAWDNGDCEQPKPDRAAAVQFRQTKTFFGLDCDRVRSIPIQAMRPTQNSLSDIAVFDPPKPKKAFYKSPWFWTGVGVVAAVVIVKSAQQRHGGGGESTTATTSYGFR